MNIACSLRFAAVADHQQIFFKFHQNVNLRVLKSAAIISKMHCAAPKIAFESFIRGCYFALAGLALGHVGDVALCLGRVLQRDRVPSYLPVKP